MLALVVAALVQQLAAAPGGGLNSAQVEDVFRFHGAALADCGGTGPVELALKISPAGRATPLRAEQRSEQTPRGFDRTRCIEAAVGQWDFPIAQTETTVTGTWANLPPAPAGPARPDGLTQAQLDAVVATARRGEDCLAPIPGLADHGAEKLTVALHLAPSGVVLSATPVALASEGPLANMMCALLHARTLRFPTAREATNTTITWSTQSADKPRKADGPEGLEKADIKKVIDAHRGEVRFCYERPLQDQPRLAGKLAVQWMIGPDGTVLGAEATSNELTDPAVAKCVIARVKRWVFPVPKGGGVVNVTFPWIFKSTEP